MSEYDHEPMRGLPGLLPDGENIIWQGGPDWMAMAKSALHIRLAVLYFGLIAAIAAIRGDANTAIGVSLLGVTAVAMFVLFAWGVGRTTVYTLTDQRLVLRIGVALNKCINLPLSEIEAANLKLLGEGRGSIVLSLKGAPRLGYLMLWPHVRSLRFIRPQPMLRALPEAQKVAQLLFGATQKTQSVAPVEMRSAQQHTVSLVGAAA